MKTQMLKQLIIALLAICPIRMIGQTTYLPVLSEGKSWLVELISDDSESVTSILQVSGDTIVNDRVCKKISITKTGEYQPEKFAIACEQDGKVWNVVDGTFNLLFDMGWENKDHASDLGIVRKVDVITVNGTSRKRLMIDSGVDGDYMGYLYYVVEGVGLSTDYFIDALGIGSGVQRYRMLSCRENGEEIFTADDFKQKTSGITEITADNADPAKAEMYDLQGHKVAQPAQPGIYIHQGKKVVVK